MNVAEEADDVAPERIAELLEIAKVHKVRGVKDKSELTMAQYAVARFYRKIIRGFEYAAKPSYRDRVLNAAPKDIPAIVAEAKAAGVPRASMKKLERIARHRFNERQEQVPDLLAVGGA